MNTSSSAYENLPCEVYDAIEKLYRSLNIALNKHNSLGYSCGQGKMLRSLAEQGETSLSALSSLLGITPSSTGEIADKLLSAGFITKKNDPLDKRRSLVSVTDSGINELKRLSEEFTSFIASSFSSLNQDELSALLSLLNKLSDPRENSSSPTTLQRTSIRRGTRL